MENDLHAMPGHDLMHPRGPIDVADFGDQVQMRMPLAQVQRKHEHLTFGLIEDHQFARTILGQLAGQLGADRSASSGNHDRFAGNRGRDFALVDMDRFAAQQVIGGYFSDLTAHFSIEQLSQAGQSPERDAGRAAMRGDRLHLTARTRRAWQ